MARKTYRTKRAAKRAAKGGSVYRVKKPKGWRVSRKRRRGRRKKRR